MAFLSNRYESVDLRVRLFLFIIDFFGKIFFLPFKALLKTSRKYDSRKIKSILILRLDGLGDLVLSSAALREIRYGFPKAKITLVVGPWAKDIAGCIPFYDRLVVHNFFPFGFFRGYRTVHFRNELDFLKTLRQTKYDLGIDLRGDLLSIIPLFLTGAKFRFAKDKRGGAFLLTNVVELDKRKIRHEKDKALQIVRSLGLQINSREMALNIPQKTEEYAEAYLAEKGIKQSDRIITIAPCSLYYWKSWRADLFSEVISFIAKESNVKIILIGSRVDRKILNRINCLADFKAINCAGELELNQVSALIRKSAVFIGNDSSLIHIASAVKTPMIQLFGPGEPELFGYFNDSSILIIKDECRYRPCRQTSCKDVENWCMDKISVDDVIRAFRELISG